MNLNEKVTFFIKQVLEKTLVIIELVTDGFVGRVRPIPDGHHLVLHSDERMIISPYQNEV